MRILSVFAFLIIIISCSDSGSALSKQLAGSDSLVIHFNEPQTTNIAKTVTTTESKAIRKLSNYVDGKAGEAYKCGYDGNLLFYRKGILAGDISFNYSGDGCHHFMMLVNDELAPTIMTNEAANFLKSLAEGKDWY